MKNLTKIEFHSGMDCPGGEFVTITVNGEYQGRLYDLKQYTLGIVLKGIIESEMCGSNYTCNSAEAERQLNTLKTFDKPVQTLLENLTPPF